MPRRRALLSHSLAPDHSAACPSCSNSVEDTPETWLRLERWARDSGLLNSSLMPLRHKRSLQLSRNIQRKGNGCFSGKRVRVVSGSASSSPCEAYLAPLSPAGGKTTQASPPVLGGLLATLTAGLPAHPPHRVGPARGQRTQGQQSTKDRASGAPGDSVAGGLEDVQELVTSGSGLCCCCQFPVNRVCKGVAQPFAHLRHPRVCPGPGWSHSLQLPNSCVLSQGKLCVSCSHNVPPALERT